MVHTRMCFGCIATDTTHAHLMNRFKTCHIEVNEFLSLPIIHMRRTEAQEHSSAYKDQKIGTGAWFTSQSAGRVL